MSLPKLTALPSSELPRLSEKDLETYLNSIEGVKLSEVAVLGKKAEYDYLLAEIAKKRVEHSRLIRRLSQEYKTALYAEGCDVDILTGEIRKGAK